MEQEELKRLQKYELWILKEFDRVCKLIGVQYFLDSGSALGAIRHKGFIPWDDDVDVGMSRKDYEKFLLLAPKELNDCFFLQTKESDPGYYKYNAKIRLKNTFFPEEISKNCKYRGIFIDIYPFDFVSDYKQTAFIRINIERLFLRILRFRQTGSKTAKGIKKIIYSILSIVPEKKMEKMYISFCLSRNNKKRKYSVCYSYKMLDDSCLYFPTDSLFPVKPTLFEEYEFSIMKDPNMYLSIMYGDYMKLPPMEYRKNHFQGNVIFDLQDKRSSNSDVNVSKN